MEISAEKKISSLQQWHSSLQDMIKAEADVSKKEDLKKEAEMVARQIDKEQSVFIRTRRTTIEFIHPSDFI